MSTKTIKPSTRARRALKALQTALGDGLDVKAFAAYESALACLIHANHEPIVELIAVLKTMTGRGSRVAKEYATLVCQEVNDVVYAFEGEDDDKPLQMGRLTFTNENGAKWRARKSGWTDAIRAELVERHSAIAKRGTLPEREPKESTRKKKTNQEKVLALLEKMAEAGEVNKTVYEQIVTTLVAGNVVASQTTAANVVAH
jgi:hypothetical protein